METRSERKPTRFYVPNTKTEFAISATLKELIESSKFRSSSAIRIGGATAALAAGVSPQLIRLMGRWSSDIYEIYCRMSLQAALGVGRSIASQRVDSFEGGFRTESLEMLPHEVDRIRAEEPA